MTTEHLIILVLICVNILSLIIGYVLCKIQIIYNNTYSQQKPVSFFTKPSTQQFVNIDETKYVVNIKTENLEKKYNTLGEIKQTTDNISSSVNKLKNLKG
jgi:hypothetical protein